MRARIGFPATRRKLGLWCARALRPGGQPAAPFEVLLEIHGSQQLVHLVERVR